MSIPDFTPGIGLAATVAEQTYNLNDGREIRLELYDLGMAPSRRLFQRAPGQNGRTNLGGLGEPRFVDLAWRITGYDLARYYALRGTAQAIFRARSNEPVQLKFDFPDGDIRALDVYLDGQLMFGDREYTTSMVSGTFVADDPRLYDPTERTETFALEDSSGGLPVPFSIPIPIGQYGLYVTKTITYAGGSNLGAVEYPVITLYGPITDPIIENLTTGEQIDLSANGGLVVNIGDSVTIDLSGGSRRDSKTILTRSGNSVSQYLSTDSDLASFHLAPADELLFDGNYCDGNNEIRVSGDNTNLITYTEIKYYDRYIGK